MADARAEFLAFMDSVGKVRELCEGLQREIHRLEIEITRMKGELDKVAELETTLESVRKELAQLQVALATLPPLEPIEPTKSAGARVRDEVAEKGPVVALAGIIMVLIRMLAKALGVDI